LTQIGGPVISDRNSTGFTATWTLTTVAANGVASVRAQVADASGAPVSTTPPAAPSPNPQFVITGLDSNTNYNVSLLHCDSSGNACAPFRASLGGTTTYAATPLPPFVKMQGSAGNIQIVPGIQTDTNASDSLYAFKISVNGATSQYLKADGTLTTIGNFADTTVWKTSATWKTAAVTYVVPQNATISMTVSVLQKDPLLEVASSPTSKQTPGGPVTPNLVIAPAWSTVDNLVFGPAFDGTYPVTFNTGINPADLDGRIVLTKISDGSTVNATFTYDDNSQTVQVKPFSALAPATAYKITLGAGIHDFLGIKASDAYTTPIIVTGIEAQSVKVVSPLDTSNMMSIQTPSNAFTSANSYVIPRVKFVDAVKTYNPSLAGKGVHEIQRVEVLMVNFDNNGNPFWGTSAKKMKLTMRPQFSDASATSHVVGNATSGAISAKDIDASTLRILQAVPGQGFAPISDSTINSDGSVTASISASGVYILAASIATSLDSAHAYPVPFKPADGHTAIHFVNLSADVHVRIYTIMGEEVTDLTDPNLTGQIDWNVKNSGGTNVASGVYIYQIKNSYSEKRGKLVIIR